MRYILWFWLTKDSWPPSLFAFITLITYQFSLLPFACLACLCASLCSRTLVCTPYPTRCVDLSTYVILSFAISFLSTVSSRTNRFLPKFFSISPTRVLPLTFHFLLYSSPFLTSFSSLLHLPVCIFLLVWPLFFAAVRVSRTERCGNSSLQYMWLSRCRLSK